MNKSENLDVLLIYMPFGIHFVPPLGVSMLKAAVKKAGYTARINYYNLKFTQMIGELNSADISIGMPAYHYLLGEWIFSKTLFDGLPPDEEYLTNILNVNKNDYMKFGSKILNNVKTLESVIPEVKSKAEPFLESCLEEIIALNPKIVGFSSSFQQNVASLSLAKRIKKSLPETTIAFGGANCEGSMGIEMIKLFPFLDVIVSGEADETFPELVEKIINKEDYSQLRGIICRDNLDKYTNGITNAQMVMNMDSLPTPDYEDYFDQFNAYGIKNYPGPPVLSFESSRGCWWGEKSHCTFCGLNGNNMLHRSKSPERTLNELIFLKDKYKVRQFGATDNILDMAYFKNFVPALANENLNLDIFYEIKANLTKDQIKLLKSAGINYIQPGIESLNTHVLSIMKKGIKSIQNVQLLKWCKELGVRVEWNIIWGFPGETNEDYYDTAALIPKIRHLAPPNGLSPLRVDRFSPNFNFPDKFGLKNISALPACKYIYPFEKESMYNLSGFFTYEYEAEDNFETALNATKNEVTKWKANASEVDLFFIDKDGSLVIYDLRGITKEHFFILNSKERFLYLLCDKIQPLAKIKTEYFEHFNQDADEDEMNKMLNSLLDRNLIIRENNSYLSLALPLGTYSPNKEVLKKMAALLKVKPVGTTKNTIIPFR